MFDLHKVWNTLHCLMVNNSQSTCKCSPPSTKPALLCSIGVPVGRTVTRLGTRFIWLSWRLRALVRAAARFLHMKQTKQHEWIFLRYKCSKFKLAIGNRNLPNAFQGFSSPSTNRTQNKIYSNVTLRYTSEPATCEYSCQGKDMLQMLYKQYKNIPWIMSTV